jgi:hypothetical protein
MDEALPQTAPSAPPPPPYAGSPYPPRREGWWGRNWLWALPAGCLVLFVLAAACVLSTVFSVYRAVQSTPIYHDALARARANPQVIARLGKPIKADFSFRGDLQMSTNRGGTSGEADITIPIHGPKGKANLHFAGTVHRGHTRTKVLEVIFPDGTKIDLRTDAERGASEARVPITRI